MPTLEENRKTWQELDWSDGGAAWSVGWGGVEAQWQGAIWPRVFPFLRGNILEIATGAGRWTQFLLQHCDDLIGVDIDAACINRCAEKFGCRGQFFVNDGYMLPMVDTDSVDFCFSFDSLVHCEGDVIRSYVKELSRVLKPNGVAFLHHSNKRAVTVPLGAHLHHRANFAAASICQFCRHAGMSVVQQELVTWGSDILLIDAFSLIVNRPDLRTKTISNYDFWRERQWIKDRTELAERLMT